MTSRSPNPLIRNTPGVGKDLTNPRAARKIALGIGRPTYIFLFSHSNHFFMHFELSINGFGIIFTALAYFGDL